MATIELTDESFQSAATGNDIVIVDFRAPRRGFCRGFAPVFEAASGRYPDVVFARLDSEAAPELAQEFAIRAIPTPTVFRENVVRFSQAGVLQGAHRAQLADETRKVDAAQVQGDIAASEAEATAPWPAERGDAHGKPHREPATVQRPGRGQCGAGRGCVGPRR